MWYQRLEHFKPTGDRSPKEPAFQRNLDMFEPSTTLFNWKFNTTTYIAEEAASTTEETVSTNGDASTTGATLSTAACPNLSAPGRPI